MVPVREYEEAKKQITQFDWNGKEFSVEISHPAVAEVELHPQEGDVIRLNVYEEELIIKGKFCKITILKVFFFFFFFVRIFITILISLLATVCS